MSFGCVRQSRMEKLITMKTVLEAIPFSRQHIYTLMRRGEFPRSFKLGENRVAWRESDIENWIKAKEIGVPFEEDC